MNVKGKPNFIVEEMSDLTTNEIENPFATKFRNEMIKYSSNNIVLENGQMIFIDLSKDIQEKVFECNMEIFSNILRAEKMLNECYDMIKKYEMTGNNYSTSFKKIAMILLFIWIKLIRIYGIYANY